MPDARVAAIPPSEAFAPGSTGKNSPVARSSVFSASRVIPGCTRTSMSSGAISSTAAISRKSTVTPPRGAEPCPSSAVPAPQPITGTPARAQMRTIPATSSVSRG